MARRGSALRSMATALGQSGCGRSMPMKSMIRSSPPGSTSGPISLTTAGSAPQIARQREGERMIAETDAVDLEILEHALDVIARLGEGNGFDPIDDVDRFGARVAEIVDPLAHPRRPGIVGCDRQDIRA